MSFGNPPQTDEKVASAVSLQPPNYREDAPYPPPADPEHGRPCHRRRRIRRLCHFFVASLFIWVTARHVLRHCERRRFGPPPPHFDGAHWVSLRCCWSGQVARLTLPQGPDFDLGIPRTHPGEDIDSCVESADWTEIDRPEVHDPHEFPVWQRAELSLPSDAADIFLLSRGMHAVGHLQVVEATDREDIGVEVVVGYNDFDDIFERSSLCTLRRGDNGHGIGIFVRDFICPFRACSLTCDWSTDTQIRPSPRPSPSQTRHNILQHHSFPP